MQILISILVTIIVFGILIFVHESGHFFVAKACKVKVNEFSLGMGPAIFKKRVKDTLYSLRALPIGGYVQMDGEDGGGTDENSFNNKKYWQRFLILFAGAALNIILGFVLICIINYFTAKLPTTVIALFDDGASSQQSGLQVDDKIIDIDGYGINSFYDMSYAMSTKGTEPLSVTVLRDGKEVTVENVSFKIAHDDTIGNYFDLDFKVYPQKRTFWGNLKFSFDWTVSITKSIYSFLGSLFVGQGNLNHVSGPVGTTVAIGQSVSYGFKSVLLMVALISLNLGIVNLLPFPALDGGRILLLAIESVRRKPISPKVETAINATGLILLLVLMAVITLKDVINLF